MWHLCYFNLILFMYGTTNGFYFILFLLKSWPTWPKIKLSYQLLSFNNFIEVLKLGFELHPCYGQFLKQLYDGDTSKILPAIQTTIFSLLRLLSRVGHIWPYHDTYISAASKPDSQIINNFSYCVCSRGTCS